MTTERTRDLLVVAERITAALPPVVEEVVLTGSVSRGAADDLSDIELLVVTTETLDLATCFEHARTVGLERLDTWGVQGTAASRVFGYHGRVPVELVWWPRDHAEGCVAALLDGEQSSLGDALVNGTALRTVGLLETWQERLRSYPEGLAAARIEEAALTWGGFAAAGMLTLARPGERFVLVERLLDDSTRVLRLVYALNREWQPTSKRLAERVRALHVRPERLAERIEQALTEPDALRALLVMSELQAETVALAPSGPNVDRARRWLDEVIDVLREAHRARGLVPRDLSPHGD